MATPMPSQPKATPSAFGDVILIIPHNRQESVSKETEVPTRVSSLAQDVIAQLKTIAAQLTDENDRPFNLDSPTETHQNGQSTWRFATGTKLGAETGLVHTTIMSIQNDNELSKQMPLNDFTLRA
jgi:hypothetical protein